jgi:nucleoside-triphosphatase THEP1
MRDCVKIVLRGKTGSGKTAILHIIGDALRNSGFNVVTVDDGDVISEFRPTPPISPDDRLVSISTVIS